MTYFIDLRAQSKGFGPVPNADSVVIRQDTEPNPAPDLTRQRDQELAAAVQGRDVLVATHGFHVDRDRGMAYLTNWRRFLSLPDNGFFVGALWPGDSSWLPFIDYPGEGRESIQSGKILATYLSNWFKGVNSISFASHSLGARMVLETVRGLTQGSNPDLKVTRLILMAGAIDDTCLTQEYSDAAGKVEKISVLASSCDDVLKWAFPGGNLLAGVLTRGTPYWHGALGRYGPYPANQPQSLWQTPNIPDDWKFGHHNYINFDIQVVPPQKESAKFPPPVIVPPQGSPEPSPDINWQQAFAAGFASTRFK